MDEGGFVIIEDEVLGRYIFARAGKIRGDAGKAVEQTFNRRHAKTFIVRHINSHTAFLAHELTEFGEGKPGVVYPVVIRKLVICGK